MARKWSHTYDHRSLRLVERCNRSVLEALRKIKLVGNTERWWNVLLQMEKVLNGQYHQALGMAP